MLAGMAAADADRLVASGLARQIDLQHLAGLEQRGELAVDSREVQRRHAALAQRAQLGRRERAALSRSVLHQRIALAGLAFAAGRGQGRHESDANAKHLQQQPGTKFLVSSPE